MPRHKNTYGKSIKYIRSVNDASCDFSEQFLIDVQQVFPRKKAHDAAVHKKGKQRKNSRGQVGNPKILIIFCMCGVYQGAADFNVTNMAIACFVVITSFPISFPPLASYAV